VDSATNRNSQSEESCTVISFLDQQYVERAFQ